jgi:hypothetical protein
MRIRAVSISLLLTFLSSTLNAFIIQNEIRDNEVQDFSREESTVKGNRRLADHFASKTLMTKLLLQRQNEWRQLDSSALELFPTPTPILFPSTRPPLLTLRTIKPTEGKEHLAIEQAIKSLPYKELLDKELLILEKGSSETTVFRHPPGVRKGSVVFQIESVHEEGDDVIILPETDDHIRRARTKTTFVVLKQNPESPKEYRALYAYIR